MNNPKIQSLPKFESQQLQNFKNISHGFFMRHDSKSRGPYRGDLGSNDANKSVESFNQENRVIVAQALSISSNSLLTLRQIHSARVVTVEKVWHASSAPKADGMVTRQTGLALGILSADCAPVLILDRQNGIIGAAHAGWKSALAGIIENTVEAIHALGGQHSSLIAAIGPCISQKNYQVGTGFRRIFIEANALHEKYFIPSMESLSGVFWQFDLKGFIVAKLQDLNVADVETINVCSYESEQQCYSHRRATLLDKREHGRNISAIMINENRTAEL